MTLFERGTWTRWATGPLTRGCWTTGKSGVSLGDADSDTYFQASHNEDHSEYVGTWHHPEGGLPDSMEKIVYTRMEYNDWKRPALA